MLDTHQMREVGTVICSHDSNCTHLIRTITLDRLQSRVGTEPTSIKHKFDAIEQLPSVCTCGGQRATPNSFITSFNAEAERHALCSSSIALFFYHLILHSSRNETSGVDCRFREGTISVLNRWIIFSSHSTVQRPRIYSPSHQHNGL